MTKLKKQPPSWAINGRGKRISLPVYAVMIDGTFAGEIHAVLSSGGRTFWSADAARTTRARPQRPFRRQPAVLIIVILWVIQLPVKIASD